MWYTIQSIGCRNCGYENDPLEWECPTCGHNPFTNAACVVGPLPFERFVLLVAFRFILGIPILGILWYTEVRAHDDWSRLMIFLGALIVYLVMGSLLWQQLWTLRFLRLVVERNGLMVFKQEGSLTRWMQLGWDELELPEGCTRYGWFRFLGCLLGPLHALHFLLPEPLNELCLSSHTSGAKRVRLPIAPSLTSETRLLSWLSAFALPTWINRGQVTIHPELAPSPERRLVRFDIKERQVWGDKLMQEVKPQPDDLEPPGSTLFMDLASYEDSDLDTDEIVPYQDGYYLIAYWYQPPEEDTETAGSREQGAESGKGEKPSTINHQPSTLAAHHSPSEVSEKGEPIA